MHLTGGWRIYSERGGGSGELAHTRLQRRCHKTVIYTHGLGGFKGVGGGCGTFFVTSTVVIVHSSSRKECAPFRRTSR